MDGFSGTVVQTYKVESKKKQKKGKKEPAPEKRDPPKSLKEVGINTREDVCSCIKVITEYIKQAIKLVLCAPDNPKNYEPKFGPMFCEMGDITIRLFGDLYHLLKYLVKTMCCLLASQNLPCLEIDTNNKEKKSKKEKSKKEKEEDKSLTAIGLNTRDDVCSCIRMFTKYIKEAIKIILCTTESLNAYEPKFGPMFCQMGDITIRLFWDTFNLLSYLMKAIICAITAYEPPWQQKKKKWWAFK